MLKPFNKAKPTNSFKSCEFTFLRTIRSQVHYYCSKVPRGFNFPSTIYYASTDEYQKAGMPEIITGQNAIDYGWIPADK